MGTPEPYDPMSYPGQQQPTQYPGQMDGGYPQQGYPQGGYTQMAPPQPAGIACYQCGTIFPIHQYPGATAFNCQRCGAQNLVHPQGQRQDDGGFCCIPICIPCTIQ